MARFIWLLLLLGGQANSQHIFSITDVSKIFEAKVVMVDCGNGRCLGRGYIKIIRKHLNEHLLTIHCSNLALFYPPDSVLTEGATLNVEKNNFLFFEDFNFDGQEDLLLITGNTWDVRLYDTARGKFYINRSLKKIMSQRVTNLRSDSLNGNRLVLYIFKDSHPCRIEYIWKNGKPEKVYALSVWSAYRSVASSELQPADIESQHPEGKQTAKREGRRESKKSMQSIMIVQVKEWKNGRRRYAETRRYKSKDYERLKDPYWKL